MILFETVTHSRDIIIIIIISDSTAMYWGHCKNLHTQQALRERLTPWLGQKQINSALTSRGTARLYPTPTPAPEWLCVFTAPISSRCFQAESAGWTSRVTGARCCSDVSQGGQLIEVSTKTTSRRNSIVIGSQIHSARRGVSSCYAGL